MNIVRASTWSVLLLLIALAGCGQPTEPEAEAPLTLQTPLIPPLVFEGEPLPPEEERTLERRMADRNVPGVSVAVFRDGEIVWAEGFGLADVESNRPVTPETLFQAASISKPVAAMAALRLAQDGKVDLDENVNVYLTSWKVPDNEFTKETSVTLRDLLSHTAGLTVHGFPGYARSETVPSTVGVLDGEGNTDPIRVDIPPRTKRRYSGGGYTVAQQLMVDVTGKAFPEFMAESVLSPLGMVDSTFEQPLPEALHDRAATAYLDDGTAVEGLWHVYPEMAAAGLWTTPTDLARFAMAVQDGLAGEDGPVLTSAMVKEMLTPPVEPGYGLGLSLDDHRFGHGGGNAGFRCALTALYEGGNGVVVMTNADEGSAVGKRILLTLFDHYGWPGLEPSEVAAIDLGVEELKRYAGLYRIEGYGDVTISVEGDRLGFLLPGGETGTLRPLSETEFIDPKDEQTIRFVFDETTGAINAFTGPGFEAQRVE